MEQIIEFFDNAKMFYLATTEGDQPRVRPFGGLLLVDGKMYFNTNCTKKVYEQMLENPKVELCAFDKGTWMRVSASVSRATTEELKEVMFKCQPAIAKMYKDRKDIFEAFALEKIIAIKTSLKGEEVIYEG